MPSLHGSVKLKPGPRKNDPMITSVAQNITWIVISEMANLRSSGLLEGFLSRYGAKIRMIRPTPGMVTPATIGWNMVSSSCRPRKYHGAFDGFGVWLVLASCSSGALTNTEKMNVKARHASEATNSAARRCGQVCTLSTGVALTSWIEPLLTTVSRRWVCPPGPAPTGTGPGPVGAVTTVPGRSARATAPPAAEDSPPPAASSLPSDLALAARERSSRWAGMRDSAPEAGAAGSAGGVAAAAAASAAPASAGFLSRAACARFSRCSGISVMRSPSRRSRTSERVQRARPSQGPGDAAVLADAPEVDRHEDDDDEREQQDVQHVPAQQRLRSDLRAAEQHEAHLTPEHRGVAHHVGAHRDRPQRQLIPRQQVSRERQQQREGEQDHAD